MFKVLAVCGNGMGTSMVIKMKVQKFMDTNNIEGKTESCSLGEASGKIKDIDVVLCSKHLEAQLKVPEGKHVICLKNLMDENEFGPRITEIINTYYPNAIK